jgi:hypothetical protein
MMKGSVFVNSFMCQDNNNFTGSPETEIKDVHTKGSLIYLLMEKELTSTPYYESFIRIYTTQGEYLGQTSNLQDYANKIAANLNGTKIAVMNTDPTQRKISIYSLNGITLSNTSMLPATNALPGGTTSQFFQSGRGNGAGGHGLVVIVPAVGTNPVYMGVNAKMLAV